MFDWGFIEQHGGGRDYNVSIEISYFTTDSDNDIYRY